MQYPIKKYFAFICTVARLKGAKTISLIHDIGSIRTHRLTTQQEVKRLSHSDYILATNNKMKEWLISNNFQKPIEGLGLWDYRSPYFNKIVIQFATQAILALFMPEPFMLEKTLSLFNSQRN